MAGVVNISERVNSEMPICSLALASALEAPNPFSSYEQSLQYRLTDDLILAEVDPRACSGVGSPCFKRKRGTRETGDMNGNRNNAFESVSEESEVTAAGLLPAYGEPQR